MPIKFFPSIMINNKAVRCPYKTIILARLKTKIVAIITIVLTVTKKAALITIICRNVVAVSIIATMLLQINMIEDTDFNKNRNKTILCWIMCVNYNNFKKGNKSDWNNNGEKMNCKIVNMIDR